MFTGERALLVSTSSAQY